MVEGCCIPDHDMLDGDNLDEMLQGHSEIFSAEALIACCDSINRIWEYELFTTAQRVPMIHFSKLRQFPWCAAQCGCGRWAVGGGRRILPVIFHTVSALQTFPRAAPPVAASAFALSYHLACS
jgi:hypothetical protein